MYTDIAMWEVIVSAGLAGGIIWTLDWRSGERSKPKENGRVSTWSRLDGSRSRTAMSRMSAPIAKGRPQSLYGPEVPHGLRASSRGGL